MITFVLSAISMMLGLLGLYYFMKSYLRSIVWRSLKARLILTINIALLVIAASFMLSSIAPSVEMANVFTKIAVISLRAGLVALFLFSEYSRNARYLQTKVFGISMLLGASITTYIRTESKFVKVFGFWERSGFVTYTFNNVLDLALVLMIVAATLLSLAFTNLALERYIKLQSQNVNKIYYQGTLGILLVSISVFLANKIIGSLFINNALILIALGIIAIILTISIHNYPYFLYVGASNLLGILLIDAESGILIYERGSNPHAPLVSGALWSIITLLKRQLNRKPEIIKLSDIYIVIAYEKSIIGLFLFDNYIDVLPSFVKLTLKELQTHLEKHGLIAGMYAEDKEIRRRLERTIDQVLEPFVTTRR